MNTKLLLGLLWIGLTTLHASGRPVEEPPLERMWAEAELVAVIRPLSTTNAADQLTWAGPAYGPRDAKDYRAMNTRCALVIAMKAPAGLQEIKELTLLHFRYAPTVPELNGGMFVYFDFAPTELTLHVKGGPKHPIGRDTEPTYMAFLKRGQDGRFIPVTGHYDSEPSFRVLTTPVGGAARYMLQDAKRAQAPETKAAEIGTGIRAPAEATNQAPANAGSQR